MTLEVQTYGPDARRRVGFFTDSSVCIGCKACEVACKEWNQIPDDDRGFTGESYDNTSELNANTWRHVAFVEQRVPTVATDGGDLVKIAAAGEVAGDRGLRWLMSSDVCKHCTHAACLDVCPTGAIFRTEYDTVVVQEDVCNGCGYCVTACPFGVLDQRKDDGRVWKCTLCYDRLKDDKEPACAQACPTDSIQFGEHDELLAHARARVTMLREQGLLDARLYLDGPADGIGGAGAFFLLLDDPEVYGLPPDPVDTTLDLPEIARAVGLAALAVAGGLAAAFAGGRR